MSPELSRLGIMQRYAAQKESRGVGRMTTPEAHDAALAGLPRTLDRIQDERLADILTIYRRGGVVLQRLDLTGPARADEPRARHSVETEQKRPLSPDENRYVERELARLDETFRKLGLAWTGPVIPA